MALEVTEALIIIVGFVVGIVTIFFVMQTRVGRMAQQLYDARKTDLESQFHQRNLDLDNFVKQRNGEADTQYKTQYSTEFEKWKAQFLLDHETEVKTAIKAATERAVNGSRSTLKGKITEQFAPLFPQFTEKYVLSDARFLGSPIDFIVFKNLHTLSRKSDAEPQPIEIVFVEVKADKSKLNQNEKAVKAAVDGGRVTYELLKIPIDDKVSVPVLANDPAAENISDLDVKKENLELCSRCQFGLKCECKACPNCPNNYIIESDTPAN